MSSPPARLHAVLLACVLLGGCAVDQQKEVATYRRQLDGPGAVAPLGLGPADPLTLDLAVRLANQHNEQLSIQGETYLQALIDETRAAAGFLPSVDLSASYSTARSSGGGGGGQSHSTSVPVRGSISLLNLRNFSNLQRAAATSEQRRQLLLDLQSTLLLNVAQTYYQVLRSERLVEVLENSVLLQEERVRDMQARERLGISKPLDLAQAQADVSSTRVTLLQARSDVRNARSTLAFLIGVPAVGGELRDSFDPPDPVATPEE
jgi:outer membrane protein TolC